MTALVLAGLMTLAYAALAGRLDRLSVGAPIVFVLIGMILSATVLDDVTVSVSSEVVKAVTEATLALLLFSDASTIGVRDLRRDAALPSRLLLVGLPLTLVLGTVAAYLVLPGLGWAAAALVASILAPTDAALSIPVIESTSVPTRLRRALNVESGLNDGIATPFVVVLIAVVAADESGSDRFVTDALRAIGIAVVVAAVLGFLGGRLVTWTTARGWTTATSQQLTVLVVAGLSYVAAVDLEGNGFVAAFVAGLLFGQATHHELHESTEFAETTGLFLSYVVWTLFGALLAGPLVSAAWQWRPLLYGVLSLTVLRMLPVSVALRGTRLRSGTVAFIGWFGPRGLPSVVFLILAIDDLHLGSLSDPLVQTVVWTILLSVLLHGLSAGPLATRYGRRISAIEPPPVELDG